MTSDDIEDCFPQIVEAGYTATSPPTPRYNCIAWAAGDTQKWWWPDPSPFAYWPAAIPRENTLTRFIEAFQSLDNYAENMVHVFCGGHLHYLAALFYTLYPALPAVVSRFLLFPRTRLRERVFFHALTPQRGSGDSSGCRRICRHACSGAIIS